MDVDDPFIPEEIPTPDLLYELPPAVHPAGRRGERSEKFEFQCSEVHHGSVHSDDVSRVVECERPHGDAI